MALAPDKKRLLVSLGAVGLLLLLTQVIGYQLSVGTRLKETKKVRVLSSAGQGGGASPATVLLDLRAVPDINITNFQLTFGLLEGSPAARSDNAPTYENSIPLSTPSSPLHPFQTECTQFCFYRTFLHLCSFNKLPGKLMSLSSSRHGTAQMVLGDQFHNSNGGSSVPHDGPWMLAINGGHVETGSDEHGWQKLGLMRSGSLEALRYLVKEGGNGHLAVQVRVPSESFPHHHEPSSIRIIGPMAPTNPSPRPAVHTPQDCQTMFPQNQ